MSRTNRGSCARGGTRGIRGRASRRRPPRRTCRFRPPHGTFSRRQRRRVRRTGQPTAPPPWRRRGSRGAAWSLNMSASGPVRPGCRQARRRMGPLAASCLAMRPYHQACLAARPIGPSLSALGLTIQIRKRLLESGAITGKRLNCESLHESQFETLLKLGEANEGYVID